MRALYPVFRRCELAASWRYRTREGKRKGKSPYDLLGLHLPSSDWWQLLQMAPEELEQKLLTQ
jgi:hypothetical protein